ncbi:ankyrin repeat domain-containing protein 45 isoform X1 [Dermochelys coriacea]|uniref:ankyrin repeat domain-containing protein 45 isoform X1 n=1 Tax=Dermochelys coriacea TaxID=27794 RepID=UPI001CA8664A|nr:ankyrin repeat domain-containing protein 45 isoform X1 [Dermochelys coriacea]XP_043347016.1 ankyrin repeat domain-containing protein 45 isoform X1 [Dermochelys coriacea]
MELGEATQPADTGEPKEPEYSNPLWRPALTGNVEGVHQIFADPEDPDGEKAMQLLMEKDIIGRDLLYATSMAGQSAVIRALAKYGVVMKDKTARGYTLLHCAAAWGQLETLKTLVELDADILAMTFRGEKARDIADRYAQRDCVEFLDWAEAKQALRTFIAHIQATIADPEKVQGRLNKEDKNMSLSACRVKSDWLENTKEPTRQDFLDQKKQLEDIMLPIFTKLAMPREYWGYRPHSLTGRMNLLYDFQYLYVIIIHT